MAFSSKDKELDKILTPDEALARLEHFCAYRERCPQEVYQKMAELDIVDETAEQIYKILVGDGFVDEERFALAFAGGKFRINRWGRVRIRLELQRRAIAPALIRKALDLIDQGAYEEALQKMLKKKLQQYKADPEYKARTKAVAAMVRAGYEAELVFRFL